MNKAKIRDLEKLMVLNEMAMNNLDKKIDEDFYNCYVSNDISWLIDNMNRIIDDFYSSDTTYEREQNYFPCLKKYQMRDLKEEKEFMTYFLNKIRTR